MFRSYLFVLAFLVTLITFIYGGIVNAKTQTPYHPIQVISNIEVGITSESNSNLIPVRQLDEGLSNDSVKLAVGNTGFSYPLKTGYKITSPFGWRIHPITHKPKFHAGIDIGAPLGEPVLAARTGKVVRASNYGGYGNAVMLQHRNPQENTLYGHLSKITVQVGESVTPGTLIGKVGSTGNSTGPHLHFEVRQQILKVWEAINPSLRLGKPGQSQLPFPSSKPPEEDIQYCEPTLWKKCAPPPCDIALFGDCTQ